MWPGFGEQNVREGQAVGVINDQWHTLLRRSSNELFDLGIRQYIARRVRGPGYTQRTNIITGARSLASVEILSGLNAGDIIIVSGTDQFNGADSVLISN